MVLSSYRGKKMKQKERRDVVEKKRRREERDKDKRRKRQRTLIPSPYTFRVCFFSNTLGAYWY